MSSDRENTRNEQPASMYATTARGSWDTEQIERLLRKTELDEEEREIRSTAESYADAAAISAEVMSNRKKRRTAPFPLVFDPPVRISVARENTRQAWEKEPPARTE